VKAQILVLLLVLGSGCTRVKVAADPRLREFAALKRQQTEELAGKLHLEVPAEVREFFKAAEAGDCAAVSNAYRKLQRLSGQPETSLSAPGYPNVLSVPIHETRGAYEFCDWPPAVLQRYADGILGSIPDGSVYFGGTDPGRFVITMFRDTRNAPDIAVLTPKFVITQNALVETRYVEYLRRTLGERLWLPTTNDIERASNQYASELRQRQARGEPLSPDDQWSATGRVQGVAAVMNVNGILVKMIFDHNKDQHPFFVEESYVIGWMYPHLEPHGLILKLNNEPLEKLDPAAIERDREFWARLSQELLADPKFLGTESARKTYAKMRSSIGGLYAYRRLREEAEAAYKQAITLCPASPEANFRLAQLYMEMNRPDDAMATLEQLQKLDPHERKIAAAIEQLRVAKRRLNLSK
jgi:hypothetical protein